MTAPRGSFTLPVYNIFLCLGVISEWVCVTTLAMRRRAFPLPVFALYLIYTLVADTIGTLLYFGGLNEVYWRAFVSVSVGAYCIEVGVACELAQRLIALNGTLARIKGVRFGSTAAMAGVVALSFFSSGGVVYQYIDPTVGVFSRLELADGLCRSVLFFALLALTAFLRPQRDRRLLLLLAYLNLYFGLTFACQVAHHLHNYFGSQADFFEIEVVRIGISIVAMLLLSRQILLIQSPPNAPSRVEAQAVK